MIGSKPTASRSRLPVIDHPVLCRIEIADSIRVQSVPPAISMKQEKGPGLVLDSMRSLTPRLGWALDAGRLEQ